MKYKDAKTFAADLRQFADFIETNGVKLHGMYPSAEFTAYLSESDYVKNGETGEWDTVYNEHKTRKNMRQFIKALGKCTKEWRENHIDIRGEMVGGTVTVKGYIARGAVCRKVVTGTKIVPSQYTPEREVEEFEWVCEEPALLA